MKPTINRFTATPFDFGDVRILGMGIHDTMAGGLIDRPHGLGGYLLALFHTEVTIRLHDVAQRCLPQSFLLWKPDIGQQFGEANAAWEYSWVLCDGPFLQSLLDAHPIPCQRVLLLQEPSRVEHFLQELHREYAQVVHPDASIVHHLLHLGFTEIQRQLTPTDTPQLLPAWATAMKQYLDIHYAEPLTLAQLAEYALLSVPHFSRQFVDIFGIPPMTYLTELRMNTAKFLLLDRNLSVSEIALRTGYENFGHFSTVFRRHHGVCPRAMRKNLDGEAGRLQRAEARRSRELARWLAEGWRVVLDDDYARTTHLHPQLRSFWADDLGPLLTITHMTKIDQGRLQLYPNSLWTGVVWEGELVKKSKSRWLRAIPPRRG